MTATVAGLLAEAAELAPIALSLLGKAALILAVAWLLAWLSRGASGAVRHGVWTVAVLGVLALPLASRWLPSLPVDLPGLRTAAAPAPAPGPVVLSVGAALPARTPSAQRPAPTGLEPEGAPALLAEATSPDRGRFSWPAVLLLGWATGTVLILARLSVQLAQLARVRWLSGALRSETEGSLVRRVDELARELRVRRPITVLESSSVGMPLTWGVRRPIILLPEGAREWPERRLRAVLLHELAHIRRWDYATQLASEVAFALYWTLPLVWLARKRLRAEQEQACDDLVLAADTPSLEYAEHLLAVARAFYGRRWEPGATVSMARETSLKARVHTILDDDVSRRPLRSGRGVLVLLLLTAAVLPVAAIRAEESAPALAGRAVDGRTLDDGSLWLEAEEGIAREPMVVREDLDASSGAYAAVPNGEGNDAGEVSFAFEVPQAGEYLVWGRVIGARGTDNSFYVSVDGGEEIRWDIFDDRGDRLREWGWLPISDRSTEAARPDPVRFRLSPGVHTLRIRSREDGTRLDRLLITADDSYVPFGRGAVTIERRPAYQWMEVEQARLEPAIGHDADERASGGRFVSFEQGQGAEASGTATFVFEVETAGRYVVWGRVLAPDRRANSFYVSLDGGTEVIWDAPDDPLGDRAGRWSWGTLNARDFQGRTVDPLLLELSPGRHVLRLRTREAGVRLDGILVTNDLGFRPRGMWPKTLPGHPVRVWLEAESARLKAPLIVRGNSNAAGGLYVEVDSDSNHLEAPDPQSAGLAVLRFTTPQAGLYTFWARTLARNGNENSFWVRVNGGRWIRWNGFAKDGSWRWSTIRDVDRGGAVVQLGLDAGEHLLEISPRERGARIDRLLVTNDPLAEPDARIDG